jgi:hypothetical protein
VELSDEERKRRSDQAKRLVAQGKFGGKQPGSGRPRKKRASELVAERVSQHATEIWNELWDLRNDKSSAIRLKALVEMLDIEERERGVQVEEQKQLENKSRDELLTYVLEMRSSLQGQGALPFDVEGEAAEIIEELGSGE